MGGKSPGTFPKPTPLHPFHLPSPISALGTRHPARGFIPKPRGGFTTLRKGLPRDRERSARVERHLAKSLDNFWGRAGGLGGGSPAREEEGPFVNKGDFVC